MGLFSNLFGGGGSKTTETIPKYLQNASKDLINRATKLVNTDKYEGYKGPLVAGKNSQYDQALSALNRQRGLAGENFGQADAILDSIRRPTTNYYGSANAALDRMNPLSGNYLGAASNAAGGMKALTGDYFSGAGNAANNVRSLTGDYFADAGRAAGNMKALSGDYFSGASNFLGGVNRGQQTYSDISKGLARGDTDFRSAMGRADNEIGQMASRGGVTNSAIGQFGQLPSLVQNSQGRAENLQLGTNQGVRSTLGREMGESGQGYDEAASLTRRAGNLDATNAGAINARINPYTEAVTDNILRDYTKQRDISGKQVQDQARAAGAFGGSRHGVAQGMFDQETSKGVSDIVTGQREKGYNQAVNQLNADRNNMLSSAGQLSGIQGARDAGTLGFTDRISNTAQSDANLLRQGGLDIAGATKDSAAGKMSGEQQLFGMDQATANMLQSLGKGYSDQSMSLANARLGAQGQQFNQDMSYADRLQALGRDRMSQQAQQFGQNADIFEAMQGLGQSRMNQQQQKYAQDTGIYNIQSGLARDRLGQQQQQFGQNRDIYNTQADLASRMLAQQAQGFGQGMDIVNARDSLAKGQLGQELQRYNMDLGLADAQSQLGQVDQKSWQAMAADLLGYGKEMRGITQAGYDADKARWDENQQYPYEQLNFLSSIISGQPYSRQSTTSKDSGGLGNSLLGALGTGLGAILSDENEKEDRKGADVEAILDEFRKMPVDDYRYKQSAVDSYGVPAGERTGPMAQDWQKAFGGNGREIDVSQMLGKMAGAIKGLEERTRAEPSSRGTLPRRKAA